MDTVFSIYGDDLCNAGYAYSKRKVIWWYKLMMIFITKGIKDFIIWLFGKNGDFLQVGLMLPVDDVFQRLG